MNESQESSIHAFENSCPELDVLVEEGTKLPGHIGARLSGGGFGGITVHFVEKEHAVAYSAALEVAYKARLGKEATTLACVSGPGAYSEYL